MAQGIAPTLLVSQVKNTAGWALADNAGARWRDALVEADAVEARWVEGSDPLGYLELLLAAHFATVATFVPTDVDTRIRFHAWQSLHGHEALSQAVDVVDRTDAWDPRVVSARVLEVDGVGLLSGHDGEWLAVRAGALGRALAMGASEIAERISTRIDAELDREARAFERLERARGRELDALRAATVLAHNAGDLSRVVDEWPSAKSALARELAARFVRLGHENPARLRGAFHRAGHVNKAVMATENHRFLWLRRARALRRGRELLLPIGPFFDAWGERVGSHRDFRAEDKGEVLTALLEGHEQDGSQQGYLRAIAGIHRASAGGVDALAGELPARLRKLVAGGPVREALRVDASRADARTANRYRAAVASYDASATI